MSPGAASKRSAGGLQLSFDGGSLGNPGQAYGSFRVRGSGSAAKLATLRRLRFPRGTNNEAEYWTLREAIRWILRECGRQRLSPPDLELTIQGDSLLVIRQLDGAWKAKDARMRELRDEVQAQLTRFGKVRLRHRPRRQSVAEFGH